MRAKAFSKAMDNCANRSVGRPLAGLAERRCQVVGDRSQGQAWMRRIAGCGLAALVALTTVAHANAVKDLDGYWTGAGTVKLTNGQSEAVKCVVTYRVDAQQTNVRQSLRCASAAYKINARAEFKIAGKDVSGKWEETNYAATGDVTGKVGDGNFALVIKAPTFSANMKVASQPCKQAIDIEPQGLDVAKISIALSKC